MISKEILTQYSDLQKEIQEVKQRIKNTEKQIDKIEKDGTVCDKVMGGEGGWQPFKIEGFPYPEYSKKKTLLYSRKATLANLEMELMETVNQIEEFISSVDDSRMRRIINLRFIEKLSWQQVASRIGGGNTDETVRKAFYRFMEK